MTDTDSENPKRDWPATMKLHPSARTATMLVLITLGYFVFARLGLLFVINPEGFSSFWPASGFGLAVLLLNRYRAWPGIMLAIFAGASLAHVLSGFDIGLSLGFAGVNAAEALLAAFVLVRYRHGEPIRFTRIGEVIGLIAGGVIVSLGITALLGAAVAYFGLGSSFWPAWRLWWISDGLGMLLVTPLTVLWTTEGREAVSTMTRLMVLELTGAFGLIFAYLTYLFLFVPRGISDAFVYLIYPLIVLIALRFKPIWTVTALSLLAAWVVVLTRQGLGPFQDIGELGMRSVLVAQIFLAVAASFGFLLAEVVTQHKETEARLRIAEENFRNSLDESPMGCRIYSRDGSLLYANKALLEMYGYDTFEEFKTTTREQRLIIVNQIESPEDSGEFKGRKSVLSRYELEIIRKDGQIRCLSAMSKPVLWNGRQQTQILYQDITERKKAEEQLRISEEKFRSLFRSIPVPTYTWIHQEDDFVLVDYNEAADLLTEGQIANLIGAKANDVYRDNPQVLGYLRRCFQEKASFETEMDYQFVDSGTLKTLNVKHVFVRPDLIMIHSEDITERKLAEERILAAERRYRYLFDNAPVGIVSSTASGSVIDINKILLEMHGYDSKEEFQKTPISDRYHDPKDRERWMKLAQEQGKIEGFEVQLKRKDGTLFWGSFTSLPQEIVSGEPLIINVVRDITERKQAEAMLQESEEKFRSLAEQSPNMVFINKAGRIVYVNSKCVEIMGYEEEEFCAPDFDFLVLVAPECREQIMVNFRKHMNGEEVQPYDYTLVTKGGKRIDVILTTKLIEYEGDNALIGVFTDITERKMTEEALREMNEDLKVAQRLTKIGNWKWNVVTNVVQWSEELCRINGHNPGLPVPPFGEMSSFYTPESWQRLNETLSKAIGSGESYEIDLDLVRRDGAIRRTRSRGEVDYDANGKLVSLHGTVQDVTEQKQAGESLDKLLAAVEASGEVIFMTDRDGIITYVNPEFTRLYGYFFEEVVNQVTPRILKSGIVDQDTYRNLWEGLLSNEIVNGEIVNRTKDGRLVTVWSSCNPVLDNHGQITGFLAIQRDMTERKRLQEQIMAQDRLASIGQLVSGVAHELNNPITGIVLYSELLQQKSLPDDVTDDLKVITEEAQRAIEIVRNLLTFARKQPEGKAKVQINEHIERVFALRNHEQKVNNIQVNLRLDPDLPEIFGNSTQVQQVFFNIVINAEQAILGVRNNGALTVTTERVGDIVKASFNDDGSGITPEDMKRLFTPFFTTKEVGKGTGLGLSICHGIVTEHGGLIYAESEPGKGTTFIIQFPSYKEPVQTAS